MTDTKRLANQLTEETVLGEWFQPMDRVLDKVRFSEQSFASLPMREFILFGCLRQVQAVPTLREMIQNIFHANGQAVNPCGTLNPEWFISSRHRRDIFVKTVSQLIDSTQHSLPDRLAHSTRIKGIGKHAIIATDATYQKYGIYSSTTFLTRN